jgi:hypothetical protein
MDDVPYQPGNPDNWPIGVVKLHILEVPTQEGKVERKLVGPCPRCGHEIFKDLEPRDGPYLVEPPPMIVQVVCNCDHAHSGAPANTPGCGAAGGAEVPGAGSEVKPATLTPGQRDADAWAEEAERERLPRIRQVAQDWQVSVSTITALFGAGTLISADAVVRSLDPSGWAVLYGVLAALALVSAGVAILLASLAGHPVWSTRSPNVPAEVQLREDRISKAHCKLLWSRILAFLAVALLIAGYAVRWYAPVKPPANSSTSGPRAIPGPAWAGFSLPGGF